VAIALEGKIRGVAEVMEIGKTRLVEEVVKTIPSRILVGVEGVVVVVAGMVDSNHFNHWYKNPQKYKKAALQPFCCLIFLHQ
jgi:hypothetical protein